MTKGMTKIFPHNFGLCTSCKTIFVHTNNSTYMGRNDLFLDSGIIYGDIDLSDETWHKPCHDHFKKFPRKTHNYYSTKRIIDEEIHSVGERRRYDGLIKSDKVLRLIVMKGKALLLTLALSTAVFVGCAKQEPAED